MLVLVGACGGGGGALDGGAHALDDAGSAIVDGGVAVDAAPARHDAGTPSAVRALCARYVDCGCAAAFPASTVEECVPQLEAYLARLDAQYGSLHRDESCFEALVEAVSSSHTCSFVHPGCYAWTGDLARDEVCDPATLEPVSSCGRGLRCQTILRRCVPLDQDTRDLCGSLGYVGR